MNVAAPLLKIGEVSAKSGLPIKTIRYYDEIGLLAPTVERSTSGYRLFRRQVVDRLAFIKRAQALGLSLTEVKEILAVHDQGDLPCHTVKQQIEGKVEQLTDQIHQLEMLRTELQTVLARWQENFPSQVVETTICPNLEENLSVRS
jgi:MerR family transcriptional regulator, copper efflux regulator